ncbi:MAG: XRE family transcriptional regulator, partial [Candidatus Poribacteria bacterium]|nr:XRE family transcriptional regulator [Candidatus Poribacteria bacterium]
MANCTLSSGNVFKDLDLPLPEERLAKAKLAHKINRLITMREMTQKEAANCLEISQYKMAQLRNGRLKSFTVDDLGSLLEKLECHSQLNTQGRTKKEHYVVA